MIVHSCGVVGGQIAKHLVFLGQEVHLLGYNYTGVEVIHADGYTVHADSPQPPVGDRSVSRFIETVKPDIIYAHGAPDIFGGAIAACKRHSVPFVPHTFFYSHEQSDFHAGFANRTCQPILQAASQLGEFIACNCYTLGLGLLAGNRVWYLPNGVDPALFVAEGKSYRSELGLTPDDFVVLFSGTNNSIKLPECAILGFNEFLRNKAEDAYMVVHTRPVTTRANLKALVRRLGIQARVKFITDQVTEWLRSPWTADYRRRPGSPYYTSTPYELMPAVYRTGDLLLVTTVREGMSTTILEAMSCGLPVICSDDAIISEPVIPNESGLVVRRNQSNIPCVRAVGNAIWRLYSDRENSRRMGRNGASLVRLRHDWRLIARRLLDILGEIRSRDESRQKNLS